VPTRAAYEAGKEAIEQPDRHRHKLAHGKFPEKLAFTMWSTETMRHLGMLEAQILYAMGVKPTWDEGGRVTGMEVIPQKELGRPRIDPVISLTGLYRDQFPNVMERFNEAIVMLAALDESDSVNHIRANTARIKARRAGARSQAATGGGVRADAGVRQRKRRLQHTSARMPRWPRTSGTRATASWSASTSRACPGPTGRTPPTGATS
jgi:cobalamin biosynthesis Mg chelatase CobN